MTAAELQDVTVRSRGAPVLRNISLTVTQQRVLGLVGLPGSGRSVLLHLLAGLDRADSGRAEVLGQDPSAAATRCQVGLSPDPSLLDPAQPLSQALAEAARLKGLARRAAHRMVADRLESAGLAPFAATRVRDLSAPRLTRFLACFALLGDPQLVLLDWLSLRAPLRDGQALREWIRGLARRATVIVACEDLAFLGEACDEVALLHRGTLLGKAAPSEIRSSLRGLLYKMTLPREYADLIPVPGSSMCVRNAHVEVLARQDPAPWLAGAVDASLVQSVEPSFEEACRFILDHPDAIAARRRQWEPTNGPSA